MDLWRIWANALGEKVSSESQEVAKVALIRTLIVGVNFITCFFYHGKHNPPLVTKGGRPPAVCPRDLNRKPDHRSPGHQSGLAAL